MIELLKDLRRGWSIAKAGMAVLLHKPNCFIFPLCSLLAIVVAFELFLSGLQRLDRVLGPFPPELTPIVTMPYMVLLCGLGTAFVWFFNAALTYCALRTFDGRPASILSGLAAAGRRFLQIGGCFLAEVTVGLFIKAGHQNQGPNGDWFTLLMALLSPAKMKHRYFPWIAAGYFVLPVLVDDQVALDEARRRSSAIVRQRWGETADPAPRFGQLAVVLLLLVPLAVCILVLGICLPSAYVFDLPDGIMTSVLVGFFAACLLWLLFLVPLLSALAALFTAAVYRYAISGTAPAAFADDLVTTALGKPSFGAPRPS